MRKVTEKYEIAVPRPPADPVAMFAEIHALGVERHGVAWLRANERAVLVASELGVDYTRPMMKVFISRIVLRALNAAMPPRKKP